MVQICSAVDGVPYVCSSRWTWQVAGEIQLEAQCIGCGNWNIPKATVLSGHAPPDHTIFISIGRRAAHVLCRLQTDETD